jgi:hypothetical protein
MMAHVEIKRALPVGIVCPSLSAIFQGSPYVPIAVCCGAVFLLKDFKIASLKHGPTGTLSIATLLRVLGSMEARFPIRGRNEKECSPRCTRAVYIRTIEHTLSA